MKKPSLRKNCVDSLSYEKSQLIRFAKLNDQNIIFDPKFNLGGRGGYCKNDPLSIETCFKRKLLNKVFRMNISTETYEKLKKEVELWRKTTKESQI